MGVLDASEVREVVFVGFYTFVVVPYVELASGQALNLDVLACIALFMSILFQFRIHLVYHMDLEIFFAELSFLIISFKDFVG